MTEAEVRAKVEAHNARIKEFMENSLPLLLEMAGVKVTKTETGDYQIPMDAWFTAQKFINAMHFWDSAKAILDEVRPQGFDVKVNAQSNELVY